MYWIGRNFELMAELLPYNWRRLL